MNVLSAIIGERPWLKKLANDKPILEYFYPALLWKQQPTIFPYADLLEKQITTSIGRLYGQDTAHEMSKQLLRSWVIETGAHLHIPRRYNKAAVKQGPQINALLFQGQVLWALANQSVGNKIALSLNSGRIPLDNTNSGAYLDLPALKSPMTLASKKRHPDTPQSLIPARTEEEIEEKRLLLDMYKKQKMLPENQYELGQQVLENFSTVQTSFSDQVATSHALLLNKIVPITQITLDAELIAREFILAVLKDKTSLTYSIFNDSQRRADFIKSLSNIPTGWTDEGSPFYKVSDAGEGYRLTTYNGDLHPAALIKGLEEKTLWFTGVIKFFIFMVEAGMLSVGGWTQAGYCTQIRLQAEKLLRLWGYEERADVLKTMPTDIMAVAPCWGIDRVDGKLQLLDPVTAILDPSSIDLARIMHLTGNQAFHIAAPTLYQFLFGKPAETEDDDLSECLNFAVVRGNEL